TALDVGVAGLVGAAAAYGLAIGLTQPVTMAWLVDVTPDGRRGVAMSMRLIGNRIGQSSIPLVAAAAAPAAGSAGVLLAMAGALSAAAVVTIRGRQPST